jgi:hypothetical protein
MIPLEREAYIDDMDLTGAKLSRQVEVDTPRASIYICDTSDMTIRIKNGAFLEEFLRKTVPRHADALLAMTTQTVLAAPLRALSVCLAPKDLYLAECIDEGERLPLEARITLKENGRASVTCRKVLCIMRPTDGTPLAFERVEITVEYDTEEAYVMVYLTSRKKK